MSRKRKRLKRQRKREQRRERRQRRLRTRNRTRNDNLKIRSKNKKEKKKEKRKRKEQKRYWKNARNQARRPAAHKEYQDSLKERSRSNTPTSTPKKKSGDGGSKWKLKSSERRDHEKNIKDTEKATRRLKDYKPEEMNVTRNEYTNELPPRPGIPKLPKITTPGGDLKVTRVDRPSGLTGVAGYKGDQDNRFSAPKTDYSNVYPHLKPGSGSKGSSMSHIMNKLKSRVRPVPKKPFAKGTSNYAPGVSTGPAPKKKKKNSSPFSSKK